MPPSRRQIGFQVVPATFEARVDWAFENKRICVFEDQDEVGCRVLTFDKDSDREIVEMMQKKYEEAYKVKRAELARKRLKEKSEDEFLEELRRRFPDRNFDNLKQIAPVEVTEKATRKPAPKVPSKREPDSDEEVELMAQPPNKISRQDAIVKTNNDAGRSPSHLRVGAVRDPPCATCRRRGKTCHDQVKDKLQPNDYVCIECRRSKVGCPDRAAKKAEMEEEKRLARLKETKAKSKPGARARTVTTQGKKMSSFFEGDSNEDDDVVSGLEAPQDVETLANAMFALGKSVENSLKVVGNGLKVAGNDLKVAVEQMRCQTQWWDTVSADIKRLLDVEKTEF